MRPQLLALTCILALSANFSDASEPDWENLPVQEQQILAPLAKQWNQSDDIFRRRWRHLAQRYATLSPAKQQRVHDRLKSWATLTPQARADARRRFKHINQEPVNQRTAHWEHYQQLPPDERRAFSDSMIPVHATNETAHP